MTLAADVAGHTWYHTMDLGGGVVTPGMFDHRSVIGDLGLPADTAGLRCLDVGTMDGYFAFEMERRGSREVVAVDVDNDDDIDWPQSLLARRGNDYDRHKRGRFTLAHRALSSGVERVVRSVYDLDGSVGEFDLVFCGDLLVHLKDPVTALERIRSVCRGNLVVYTPTLRPPRRRRSAPLVAFDGIDEFQWWTPTLAALERMVRSAGFAGARSWEVLLPVTGRRQPGWEGRRGVVTARSA